MNIETIEPNALAKIRSYMPALPELETVVANWMLQNPEVVVHSSLAEIAMAVGVSDTTVLRMCRRTGFRGFTDLKLSLAQDITRPTQLIFENVEQGDSPRVIMNKVFMANVQALYDTLELLDDQQLTRAAEMIKNARRVLLGGVGASASVALMAYEKFIRLGIMCSVPIDVHMQIIEATLLGPRDLAICVSHSGVTQDPILVLEQAKKNGAATICVTSNVKSEITKYADLTLLSVSQEVRGDAITARTAQQAIFDTLYVILSLQDLQSTLSNEQRISHSIGSKTY